MDPRRSDPPAPPSDRAAWYRWAGLSASELHRIEVPALGPWTADPIDDPVLHHRSRSAELLAEAAVVGRLDRAVIRRIADAQRELEATLRAIGSPVLVHRDLNPHNLLATRGPAGTWTRTGIIDFESSGGGDPLEDLRWLAIAEPRPGVQEAFLDGYRSDNPTRRFEADRIRYHQLDLVLDIATWPHLVDRSLVERSVAAAERLLAT
jgi:aminoglycoside phosphotransferase (APT) family kinase protein